MKGKTRLFYCKKCRQVTQTWSESSKGSVPSHNGFEDRCPKGTKEDYFCNDIELVPRDGSDLDE